MGVAGLQVFPPSIDFETPTSRLKFGTSKVRVE
jgi:hypothetical protein